MIHIIGTFYIPKFNSVLNIKREEELINSLLKNLSLDIVKNIHLFVDDDEALLKLKEVTNNSDKIIIIEIGKKPKYIDYFNYIVNNINDEICMIVNSDIYILSYDIELLNKLYDNRHMYALTRYEENMSCPLIDNYLGSHDCYIFNTKFMKNLDKDLLDKHTLFSQNVPGIETHIISFFKKMDFKVFNPCKQIKIVHLHSSQLRNYTINNWVGLHSYHDVNHLKNSEWYIPPTIL